MIRLRSVVFFDAEDKMVISGAVMKKVDFVMERLWQKRS
jgi:hypothetical protein